MERCFSLLKQCLLGGSKVRTLFLSFFLQGIGVACLRPSVRTLSLSLSRSLAFFHKSIRTGSDPGPRSWRPIWYVGALSYDGQIRHLSFFWQGYGQLALSRSFFRQGYGGRLWPSTERVCQCPRQLIQLQARRVYAALSTKARTPTKKNSWCVRACVCVSLPSIRRVQVFKRRPETSTRPPALVQPADTSFV